MDDLLNEFLADTVARLEELDADLEDFIQTPNDQQIQARFVELFHTIKGTSGFLALPRLEAIAQAGERSLDPPRLDAVPVTRGSAQAIVAAVTCIRGLLDAIAATGAEPEGDDRALLSRLETVLKGEAPQEPISPESHRRPSKEADILPLAEPDRPRESELAAPAPAAYPIAATELKRIERISGLIAELVHARNRLTYLLCDRDDVELEMPLERLSDITSQLGEDVMEARGLVSGETTGEVDGSFTILTAITIASGAQRFALPRANILELVTLDATIGMPNEVIVHGQSVRGYRLSALLELGDQDRQSPDFVTALVVQSARTTFALTVDRVFDAQEIVVRPLAPILQGIGLYSGTAILSDGGVALLLDPEALAAQVDRYIDPVPIAAS